MRYPPGGHNRGRARALRRRATDAELKLWYFLRNRDTMGVKFRQQHPIGNYVLDFFCYERSLAVEVDGSQHFESVNLRRDEQRTAYLERLGIRVLRFDNRQVLLETDAVVSVILDALNPSPNPLPQGEG